MNINVMIAGAQKAGTSSLKYYLEQHPEVSSHMNLECDYFTSDHDSYEEYFAQYFESPRKVVLAKMAHLYKEESFLQNLHDHNPNCKIIFVLREPVERLVSAYDMGKRNWIDFTPEAFIEALDANDRGEYDLAFNTLVKLGDYGRVAKLLYQYFTEEQVVFVSFKRLKENPQAVCKSLYRFMGVNDTFVPDITRKNVAYTYRSAVFGKVLILLKGSRLKSLVKRFLPYSYFLKISKQFEKLNRKEAAGLDKISWNEEVLSALTGYYEQTNRRFDQITGLSSKEFY